MTRTHTAREIANWFLVWAEQNDATLSNLKVQKLLYYAQGNCLGRTDRPLFDDEIEAWAHGPVVRSVYHDLKDFGNGPVDVDEVVDDTFDWDDFKDVENVLMQVWNTYGQYAAWALRERTHSEAPWKSTFAQGTKYLVIPQEKLREFFAAA